MDTWVAANSSVLTTKLIMPESATFNTGLSDPALDDPNAVNNISIVGGHIYGTTPSYYTNAFKKGKEVWMTEHYLSPASSGAQPGIADALLEAKEVNDSMSVGNYSAYVWWWIVDWSESTNIGLADENGNPTYYGYAVGQYSKFVRPGYVRSNATYNPVGSVYVTAYNGDGHYVIVALNLGSSAQSQTFLIQNQTVSSLTPYQTTARESIAPLTPLTVSGNTFTYTLPAQSITTFIQ
jgi:glucuronoarabinoxylan endo-1,4-beta-xylanase